PNTEPDLAGYTVYSGTKSHVYDTSNFVGKVTTNSPTQFVNGVTNYFAITAKNTSGFESDFSNEVAVQPITVNSAPVISGIQNLTIPPGSSTGPIPFTAQDRDTGASNLMVTGTSSNPALLPASGILISSGGTNRSVTLTPMAAKIGSAQVNLAVSDGSLTTSNSFVLTVAAGQPVKATSQLTAGGFKLNWGSMPSSLFRIYYKTNLSEIVWTQLGSELAAVGAITSFTDAASKQNPARFYRVFQTQ
ncbi:MAG TPA: hypothetical protein VMZ27_11870, partial [Candidatus Saccharimonadales bacterium]|nr:hypothetical protein [Candidatus Saccharimonadales bacterium]